MQFDLWDSVKMGAEKIGVPVGTVRTWKKRGKVPAARQIDIYLSLQGTDREVPLESLRDLGGDA